MASSRIDDCIKNFKRLPVLPAILARLMEACNDENVSLHEIASLIATDPGLTSRVLFLANSAYYGGYQRIEHIDQAVFRLGKKTLKSVVMSAAVHQVFKGYNGYGEEALKNFWRHSLLTALIAKGIAERTKLEDSDHAFFSGLVHDIGRLVLAANFPEEYKNFLELDGCEHSVLLEEEAKLAATHAEVAAWLLDQWKVDPLIVDAVLYHHETLERVAGAFPLVKVIYSANILARMTESHGVRCDRVMSLLGLTMEDTSDIVIKAEEELDEMARSLGLEISAPVVKIREGVEDMAHLFATMEAIVTAKDEQEIINAIYEGIRVLCDVREAILLIYDGEGKNLISYGDPFSRTLSIPAPQVQGMIKKCLESRKIISSYDVSPPDRSLMDEQLIRRLGKGDMVLVPLCALGSQIGLIAFGVEKREKGLLERTKSLLGLLSSVSASALKVERMKREEERKIQEERLKAIHNLMRRIAHEINNPLSIIKNFLSILSSRLEGHQEVEKEIRIIKEEIDRITRILPELSVSGEKKPRPKTVIDINALIEEMIRIISPVSSSQGVQIKVKTYPLLPEIYGDRDGIKQILINLVKNAVEALERGGEIEIETRLESVRGSLGINNGMSHVVIEISDNGPGIPEHIQRSLFEPCVSTKGKGHAGLGLSVAYQQGKEHGGQIDCISKTGVGTKFIVRLPVANKRGG
ncbi:MAG: HDOD domain-containing protein [Syntrophales bacterium]|nr:HDOD domain-containing protein [Syntrophales bacterium]